LGAFTLRESVDLEVVPATRDHAGTIANLFELYAYDFSEFHDVELGNDGRFGCNNLPLYWSEPNRHAFLFSVRQKLAGFALVKRGSEITGDECVWDMAEFFIVRRYRRHRLGTAAARQIWTHFAGRWEVRVMENNHAAYGFWAHAVATALNETVSPVHAEVAGRRWYVFSFDCGLSS
jgi:predicted acetyltransferase